MRARLTAITLVALAALIAGSCGGSRNTPAEDAAQDPTTTAVEATSFGDLPSPCGTGTASGATDQGVTDTTIRIGYGDDAGYAGSPGLFHQMSDAVRALVGWCNDQGGINGRTVDATYYDAKISDVTNVWIDACTKEFFMVGQGFGLDYLGEPTRRQCGLPTVAGFATGPAVSNAPLKWEPFPIPAEYTNAAPAAQLAELYPEEINRVATIHGAVASSIGNRDKVKSAWPAFGYTFLACDQEYNIAGEADWKPIVQRLKDCGAEMVYFLGAPFPNFVNLLEASAQLDFSPVWYVDTTFYDDALAEWNTSGLGDRVYLRSSFTPLFEADTDPATQQYIDLVTASGGDLNQIGQQSASAFLLWATAAQACGSQLTRACVAEQLDAIHDWTGGGLHTPADPGANLPSQCGMLMKLEGTSFVRVAPTDPGTFECDPAFAAKVSGAVLESANLDANRISQL